MPGIIGYAAIRTNGDSGTTVIVCQDRTGTDESLGEPREWVKENVNAAGTPPAIVEGETSLCF